MFLICLLDNISDTSGPGASCLNYMCRIDRSLYKYYDLSDEN